MQKLVIADHLRATQVGEDNGATAFWHLEDGAPVVRHVVMTLAYCGFDSGPPGGIGHEIVFRAGADLAFARRFHPTLDEIWDAVERAHAAGQG